MCACGGVNTSSKIYFLRASVILVPSGRAGCRRLMLFFMLSMYFLYCQGKGFVDCRFLRSWFRCPFAVAILLVRCLVTNLGVNPGQVMTWLFLKACKKLEIAGEKHVACLKSSRSLCVCFLRIMMFKYSLKVDEFERIIF